MNEEQKNIETCLPENILSEVANVPTDPQFVSLTDEALDPLKQQALQQAGYDGYKEVVMYHQPYTFTSQVKQMKSNLILLLRRLWRFPFGRGTTASSDAGSASSADGSSTSAAGSSAASAAAPIRSLADMWQHYITRLKGNPEYGIPSRLSSLTDLPDAPALLADRKIGGVPEAVDGSSLIRVISDRSLLITTLEDDNVWGELADNTISHILDIMPNLTSITIGCQTAQVVVINGGPNITHFHMPHIKTLGWSRGGGNVINITGNVEEMVFDNLETWYIHRIYSPALRRLIFKKHVHFYGALEYCSMFNTDQEELTVVFEQGSTYETTGYNSFLSGGSANLRKFVSYGLSAIEANNGGCISGSYPALEELILPDCERIVGYSPSLGSSNYVNLRKIQFGTIHSLAGYFTLQPNVNLIHFEFGEGTDCSLPLSSWSPTNALDASRTDLIEEGSTAANNLEQFLSNFKTYIAERLTGKGTGLTLTLSQEVRNAIHAAEDEYGIENIIITKKGWTISPAPN